MIEQKATGEAFAPPAPAETCNSPIERAKPATHPDRRQAAVSGKLVSGDVLLEILFDESSRPSMRWLRELTHSQKIPSVRLGRLIFYNFDGVKAAVGL